MSTALSTEPAVRPRRRHGTAGTIAIGVTAAAIVIGLLLGSLTFAALALAFPIAVPFALQFHLPVPASDVLIAQRFADVWWVFAAVSFGLLVASGVVTVKTVEYLESPPRG